MRAPTLIAVLALTTGCSTYYDHRFSPAPVEADLYVEDEPDSRARGLMTVVGIRRPDDGRGAVVEARLRIENLGANPVELVGDSLSLLSADLREMGTAAVSPEPGPIGEGQHGTYSIEFELPDGHTPYDYDLQGLNLKFAVDFGERRVLTGITFDRSAPFESRDPRVSFGFGYFHAD